MLNIIKNKKTRSRREKMAYFGSKNLKFGLAIFLANIRNKQILRVVQ